ncbi:putative ribosome-binding factor A, mitochondrial [Orussus abietinus]|uniref:putative ribosome-binding factor A, mitochondrial n=1 Tax=Orussus abietinus TaxID=222816 RepID=UPI00062627F9|nr:putative ribosome-binding factor A, mitochondrial [Orussus abietinus]
MLTMLSRRGITSIPNLYRAVFIENVRFKSYLGREVKFMAKLLKPENPKRKSRNRDMNAQSLLNSYTSKPVVAVHDTRRMAVLNTLFMHHITDLMATGEVAAELVGRGIEVTGVKISPNFCRINAYWIVKKSEEVEEVSQILQRSAGHLRHELSQLRVMGVVPVIEFVHDKQVSMMATIENALREADYGEDFEPTNSIKEPTEAKLKTMIPIELLHNAEIVCTEIDDLKSEQDDTINTEKGILQESELNKVYDVSLPPMRNDVLGLNHSDIMTKVKRSLKKTQEAIRNHSVNDLYPIQSTTVASSSVVEYLSASKEHVAFSKFLRQRKREKGKQIKKSAIDLREIIIKDDVRDDSTELYTNWNDDFENSKYSEDETFN